jgi:archaellum component FlaC
MGGTAASVYAARGQGQGEPLATGEVGTEAAEEDLGVLPEDFAGPSGDELEMLAGQLGSSLGGSITSMVSAYAGCISDIDYTISELGEWYDNISGEIEAVKKDIVELKASSEEDSSDSASQIRALEERQSGLEAELAASVDEVRAGLEQLIGNLASQAGETDGKIMKYVELVEAAMECDLGELKARLEGVADDANGSLGSLTGRVTANEDSIAGINDAMDELKKTVSDGKSSLASAITVEGVATSSDASYAVLADNVGRLSVARYNAGYGAGVLDTKKGTATADVVLKGSTFTSVLGVEVEGDMPDNGSLDWKPSGSETYNVPFGYYSGGTLDSSEAYNSGVSEGYDSGYSQGYNDGYKDADKEMVYYSGWLYPAYKYKEYDDDECNAFVLKLPTCSWSMARTSMSDGYAGGNWIHGGPTEYTFKGPEWHASSSYFSRIWVEAWYLPE